jgi:hypothetical protein
VPPRRTALVSLVSLVAVGLVSGCAFGAGSSATPSGNGIAASPASDVLSTAISNARAQTSVRLVGTGSCPDGAFSVDMHLRKDENAVGTITLGKDALSVVSTPEALYVKGPATFWTALTSAAAATRVGQRWVKLPRTASTCIAAITSFSTVLANYLGYPGAPTKQPSSIVFGTPAVLLQLSNDVSFWVGTQGTPLPVRISDPVAPTAISLVDWGTPVTVTVPSAADVLDSSVLRSTS